MKLPALVLACLVALGPVVRLSAQDPAAIQKPTGPPRSETHPPDKNVTPLADVLADYSKLIGKQIITDNTANPTYGLVLVDLNAIAPPQRINLIGKVLFLNGYTLIDADKDTVIVLGPGKNPRSVGVPLYTRPDELPADERVFSYLFKIEHRDPIEIAGHLQQLIPPSNDVNFTADTASRTVIATGPTSVMRVVLRVVAAFDVAGEAGR